MPSGTRKLGSSKWKPVLVGVLPSVAGGKPLPPPKWAAKDGACGRWTCCRRVLARASGDGRTGGGGDDGGVLAGAR